LALALDEAKESDVAYDIEGFKYVVDKEFIDKVQPIKVDFVNYVFKIDSSLKQEKADCDCSSAGTCG
jgi:iron-sulfur cluster assembly protein